jgi:hypothetical protein
LLTSFEAVHRLVGAKTTLIRDVELEGQQILKTILVEDGVHSEETAISGTKGTREVLADAINSVSVQNTGQSVEL